MTPGGGKSYSGCGGPERTGSVTEVERRSSAHRDKGPEGRGGKKGGGGIRYERLEGMVKEEERRVEGNAVGIRDEVSKEDEKGGVTRLKEPGRPCGRISRQRLGG